jgi:plastocyanin/mono/diheme cytochrome c family protein
MNTSKQINIMVALIFFLLIALGAYTLFDPTRQQQATDAQTDLLAQRGAALFAADCRPCHGDTGQGRIGPALNRAELRDPAKLASNQAFVKDTITCGRVGTLMPTWGQAEGGPLSDEQIRELITLITVDPNDAWTNYVQPQSEALNAQATPLPVADLLKGSITGSTASVCGQKVANSTPEVAATPGTPSTSLNETATDNKFSQTSFTVPSGQAVTLAFSNQGNAIHNWNVTDVKDTSGKTIVTSATGTLGGQSTNLTFTIATPGTYHFQCDFHPTEMLGTLFVQGPGGAAPAVTGTVPAGATPVVGAPGGGQSAGTGPAAPAGGGQAAPTATTVATP